MWCVFVLFIILLQATPSQEQLDIEFKLTDMTEKCNISGTIYYCKANKLAKLDNGTDSIPMQFDELANKKQSVMDQFIRTRVSMLDSAINVKLQPTWKMEMTLKACTRQTKTHMNITQICAEKQTFEVESCSPFMTYLCDSERYPLINGYKRNDTFGEYNVTLICSKPDLFLTKSNNESMITIPLDNQPIIFGLLMEEIYLVSSVIVSILVLIMLYLREECTNPLLRIERN